MNLEFFYDCDEDGAFRVKHLTITDEELIEVFNCVAPVYCSIIHRDLNGEPIFGIREDKPGFWSSINTQGVLRMFTVQVNDRVSVGVSVPHDNSSYWKLMFHYDLEDTTIHREFPIALTEEEYFQYSTLKDIPVSLEVLQAIASRIKRLERNFNGEL